MKLAMKMRILQRADSRAGGWVEKRASVVQRATDRDVTLEKQAGLGEMLLHKAGETEFTPAHREALEKLLDLHGIPNHPTTIAKFEDLIQGAKQPVPDLPKAGMKEWLLRHRGKLGLGAAGVGGLLLARSALSRPAEDTEQSDVASIPPQQSGF